jgi:hypothetical protein
MGIIICYSSESLYYLFTSNTFWTGKSWFVCVPLFYAYYYVKPLTADARVRAHLSPCGICSGQSGNGAGFSPSSSVSPVSVIPPLLHEVCDSPDQAAHCHTLCPTLGASSLTPHLAGTEERIIVFITWNAIIIPGAKALTSIIIYFIKVVAF